MFHLFRMFEKIIDPYKDEDSLFFKQKPTLYLFISKIKFTVIIVAIAGIAKACVDVGVLYIVGLLIDSLNNTLPTTENIFFTQSNLIIIAGVLFFIVRPLTSLIMGLLCNQCIRAKFSPLVRWFFYLKVVNNDISYFNKSHAGKISSAVWQSGQAATELLISSLQIIWSNVAYIVLVIGFMSVLNPIFSIIIFIWLLFYTLLSCKFAPEIKRRSRKSADASNVINGHLVDIFSNIYNVKSFSPEGDERSFIRYNLNDFIIKSQHFLRAITLADTLLIITSSTAMVAVGYVCIISWQRGLLTVGEISVVFGLVFRLESQLSILMSQLTGAMRSLGLFNTAIETLNHNNKVIDSELPAEKSELKGDILLNRVYFGYQDNKPVINNLTLHIRQGEKIAVVGESGSGKSTLINLLLRFYDPEQGEIIIDEINIKNLKQHILRSNFSVVTQDNILFNRTIFENITFGCAQFDENDVIEAARLAKALEFINSATDGVNTGFSAMVGDRGVKLSGGQRQRLSICRAILRNAPILILDEATSALDSVTESDIQDSLNEIMADKTVIAIAHRLSTVIYMDRIIVLSKGEIIEEGTHEELVSRKGKYYSLWKQQANLE